MTHPKFPKTAIIERTGVYRVAAKLTEMGLIFRETANSDTGIDGYIEEVNNNQEATGRLLAVQIKSGASYLHDHGDNFAFYTDESHIKYWKLYPIPVLLCVHIPEKKITYFQSIKCHSQELSDTIYIPKKNILSIDNRDLVFANLGGYSSAYHSVTDLYNIMKNNRIPVGNSYVSFMDLFVGGLTNLCTNLLCDTSVLYNLIDLRGKLPMFSIGEKEHDFIWEFITFITKENIAVVNYDSCLFDWKERKMDPRILVALTYRGIEYRDYVEKIHPGTIGDSPTSILIDYNWNKRMEKLTLTE